MWGDAGVGGDLPDEDPVTVRFPAAELHRVSETEGGRGGGSLCGRAVGGDRQTRGTLTTIITRTLGEQGCCCHGQPAPPTSAS